MHRRLPSFRIKQNTPQVYGFEQVGYSYWMSSPVKSASAMRLIWRRNRRRRAPFGNADQLERAMLVAQRFNFRTDEGLRLAFHVATHGCAQALGLSDYGLDVGCAADMVLLDGENVAEAVVTRPPRRLVVKGGRVVARDGTALV